jgi:First Longin domain of INTU, CCZ1 and HPS4
LGQTDVTVHEQLVFSHPTNPVVDGQSKDTAAVAELDRRLRAIGLAQGIVQFARAFSPEAPVMEVRTQKGFTVPLEVEKGWWMLAVIAVVAVQILTIDCANADACARRCHPPVRPMRDNAKCIPSSTASISYVQVFTRPIPGPLDFHHHTTLPILR